MNIDQDILKYYRKLVDESLTDLMNESSNIRNERWGKTLTYSRKVFVPLTNMCRNNCGYCTFVQSPKSEFAKILTPSEVMQIVRKGEKNKCKEVLFSLGEKPEIKYDIAKKKLLSLGYSRLIDYLREMCVMVLNETSLLSHTNMGTMNEEEIDILRPVTASMGMMLETSSLRLMKKGGAHFRCPDKVPFNRLQTIEYAGKKKVPFTTGILIGIGENWNERIESLLAINELHKKYGHIQEVIIQNFRTKKDIRMSNFLEPSKNDILKTIAIARIILHPDISIQAPPNLSSFYLEYIKAGINDWGGISPVTIDYINPEREWPEIDMLKNNVQLMGHSLQERLTIYPNFQKPEKKFTSPEILSKITKLTRADGLANKQRRNLNDA